jgi:hypothetical protein
MALFTPGIRPLSTITLGPAATYETPWFENLEGMSYVAALVKFARTSGGTSVNLRLQTSLDQGVTAMDIMHFSFAITSANKVKAILAGSQATDLTPGDNTLTGDGIVAILGDRLRWKYTLVGTYVATLGLYLMVR